MNMDMDLKLYGFGFYLFRWIYLFIYSDGFELGHGFGSIFVNFQQIPSMIGTFRGIIISFNLQNGFGFHLDLDLRRIIHGLGFVFEILNGFGYGLGLQIIWIWIWIWICNSRWIWISFAMDLDKDMDLSLDTDWIGFWI